MRSKRERRQSSGFTSTDGPYAGTSLCPTHPHPPNTPTGTTPHWPATSRPDGRTGGTSTAPSRRRTRRDRSPTPTAFGGRPKLFVLDMFPYPSGAGLHVGHPLGYIGTDVYSRYKRMTGHNVLHTMGFDTFGLPAEQYAVQTGQHPTATTDQNVTNMRRQLRRLGLDTTPDAASSTTDPGYYRWTQWIFSQIFDAWYDTDADGARRARSPNWCRARRRRRATPDGRPWATCPPANKPTSIDGHRLAYVCRRTGQLVPGPRHGRRQRRGHRRRPQRPGQLPGVQAQHAPVDDAHHRLRRPADRRPRPARVDRRDQDDAAQLDRPQRTARVHRTSAAGTATSGLHHPARHRCSGRRSWCSPPSTRWSPDAHRSASTPQTVARVPAAGRSARRSVDRQDDDRDKTGVFTGSYAINPVTGSRSRCGSPTTC